MAKVTGAEIKNVFTKRPHLTITKTETSTRTTVDGYLVGDVITFSINVVNDGNVTINDINVLDKFTVAGKEMPYGATLLAGTGYTVNANSAHIDSMDPGASITIQGTYTVVQANENTKMVNRATATGKDPDGDDPTIVPGETPEIPITAAFTTATVNFGWLNDTAATRPGAIGVQLFYVDTNGNLVAVPDSVKQVTRAGGYTATVEKLPRYDKNGQRISYVWRQNLTPNGYTFVRNNDRGEAGVGPFFTTIWNIWPNQNNFINIEDFDTPLGLGNVFNNVGDCFE